MKPKAPPVHGKTSLTLKINGVSYQVFPLPLSYGCRSYRLKKVGEEVGYRVSESNVGTTCTCPDFNSRDRKGGCKHCKALRVFHMVE